MAATDILRALQEAQMQPIESGYGMGANVIGSLGGAAMSPRRSSSANIGIGVGSALLQGLLSGLARRDAATQNAGMYDAFAKYQAGDKSVLEANPRLKPLALAMEMGQKEAASALAQKEASRNRGQLNKAMLDLQILQLSDPAKYEQSRRDYEALTGQPAPGAPGESAPTANSALAQLPPEAVEAQPSAASEYAAPAGDSNRYRELVGELGSPEAARKALESEKQRTFELTKQEKEAQLKEKSETNKEISGLFEAAEKAQNSYDKLSNALRKAGPTRQGPGTGIAKIGDVVTSQLGRFVGVETPSADTKISGVQNLDDLFANEWAIAVEPLKGQLSNREGAVFLVVPPSPKKTNAENVTILENVRRTKEIAKFKAKFLKRATDVGLSINDAKAKWSDYLDVAPIVRGSDSAGWEFVPENMDVDFDRLDADSFRGIGGRR